MYREKPKDTESRDLSSRGPGRNPAYRSDGILVVSNRLGGTGAVELMRPNRIDIFDGLDGFGGSGGGFVEPDDPFDLSAVDKDAADKLRVRLSTPGVVRPFSGFSVSWEVTGPKFALDRVNSYQLNAASAGPLFGFSAQPEFSSEGFKVSDSEIISIERSGRISLWARFGSGIRELAVNEVDVDLSNCDEDSRSMDLLALLLGTGGAAKLVENVEIEAGEDVTVSVTSDAVVTHNANGFTFQMGLRLSEGSKGTLDVNLSMQFMIKAKGGNLIASFHPSGSRSVEIVDDLNFLDDAWHFITLSDHNLNSFYKKFGAGLKTLADGFATAVGRDLKGLPAEVEDEQEEAQAPKAVDTRIDSSGQQLIVTLCPIDSGLVSISALLPESVFKLET